MLKLIVIDDDDDVREIIKTFLKDRGFEIFLSENGEEGLAFQKEINADLVITDIVMPKKEGIQTILELRRDYPNLKIIAISGGGFHSANDNLEIAQNFGANAILPKPFKQNELIEIVDKVIG